MPRTCPECSGSRRVKRPIKRSWWQALLLRPAVLDELCPRCGGIGVIKGSPDEEREFAERRQRQLEARRQEPAVAAERTSRPAPGAGRELGHGEPSATPAADQVADIRSWLSMLGRNDLLGPETHRRNLIQLGDRAIPHLLRLLDLPLRNDRNDLTEQSPDFQNNVTIVAAVAELLGELGAKQAVPKLKALAETNWFEVQRNVRIALLALEKSSATAGPRLDRQDPYRQIANLWTTIFQGKQMPLPPDALNAWATDAITAIADLPVPEGKRGNAWAMLGSLYYKSINPAWDGDPTRLGRCQEAKHCYEEALSIQRVPMWERFMERL